MEFFIFGDKINRRNIADFFSQLSEKKNPLVFQSETCH